MASSHTFVTSGTGLLRRKRPRPERINYPKKRASVACDTCRSRKTKCDAAKPACAFCADVGAQCIYRKPDDRDDFEQVADLVLPATPDEHEIITRLARIEELLQNSQALLPAAPLQQPDINGALLSPTIYDTIGVSPESTHSTATRRRNHASARQTTIGVDFSGLARLMDRPCPSALTPLRETDCEEQLEAHLRAGESMFSATPVDLASLNLSPRRCWQLQQIFARDVLPWCPILDQQDCAQLVAQTAESGFVAWNAKTALVLLILALGAYAQESGHLEDRPEEFPGVGYFRLGCQIIDGVRISSNTIVYAQCQIFISFYLLYSLRPLQAFEAIRLASSKLIMLLQLRTRLSASARDAEMVHRAYWACYLIEHELQGFFPFSAHLLQDLHEEVPLPMSDYDEPGIYWFLSEIALRRIWSRPRDGVGWNMNILYEPLVADEIANQMVQWHVNLPSPVKFSLEESADMRPLLDPHKVFLRTQFYAITALLHWQHVVRLLTPTPSGGSIFASPEYPRLRDAATKSLAYAVYHVYSVESLFQHRHLLLIANFVGLQTVIMLLICALNVPELAGIRHEKHREAIFLGWKCLKTWEGNEALRRGVQRIEELMVTNGLELS